jgi:hypothetical protein
VERVVKGAAGAAGFADQAPAAKPVTADERREKMLALAREWLLPAGSGLGGLALLFVLRGIWKSNARYRFPEFEVECRLAGDHAAGIGAVISFASPTLSPGVQREQVPDYLHRA